MPLKQQLRSIFAFGVCTLLSFLGGSYYTLYFSDLSSRGLAESSKAYDIRDDKVDCNGVRYKDLRAEFLDKGGVTFRSCSLTDNVKALNNAEKFTGQLKEPRISNAYMKADSVLEIAVDSDTVDFLGYLHGIDAFPFQTLNFPRGTQQATHSDAAHFDTLPTRGLMTAAWVALEDIDPGSGPLIWYPGSHKMGIWDLEELGVRPNRKGSTVVEAVGDNNLYTEELQKTIDRLQLKPSYAKLKRGESFVWAASLLHGGSAIKDPSKTRKSQVTHYWLEGAKQYWVPRLSYPNVNQYALKCSQPVCSSSKHTSCAGMMIDW
eukprot:CAMPEP_0175017498 /NCGR_PEP_ID=MMETSP0005-20121125/12432_1 /TAXON_ID=420556 /ORGANISM="Ochromonas sp., Strain CCMP1393" /LENGTH=318 /DNA_ID=CAMNT_0016274921 /DNA_START=17 /DNA_END=970 /DNA_ORIENTATION=+